MSDKNTLPSPEDAFPNGLIYYMNDPAMEYVDDEDYVETPEVKEARRHLTFGEYKVFPVILPVEGDVFSCVIYKEGYRSVVVENNIEDMVKTVGAFFAQSILYRDLVDTESTARGKATIQWWTKTLMSEVKNSRFRETVMGTLLGLSPSCGLLEQHEALETSLPGARAI